MSLKTLRIKAGLSQQNVADEIGVNRSNVARWESGEQLPRADKLVPLAQLYKCTVDELLRKEE